jgi:protein-L-isoaspartate(D-aspartate) O-methyltransferase
MSTPPQSASFTAERNGMVQSQLRRRGVRNERVLDAMTRVPRHQFVPDRYQAQAYEDHPIPIGFGQTISQPYIVALMLEALSLQPTDTVLEVGTGSGYQTALLAELAAHVYSIERHAPLAENAARILRSLGYTNATVLVGDGSKGVPHHAPFDAIIVSAAAPRLPAALFLQLAKGGRMIVPVGPPDAQELQLVRQQDGRPLVSHLEGCRFVPLIEGEGYSVDE